MLCQPLSSGMKVGDAPGLADHTLPLAAHQNHPGEASDLTLCSRLFPHQAPARLLWNLLPVSRKENERKSPSKRSSSCQIEKPWLNLPLVSPLLPGDAPGITPTPPLQEQESLSWGCSPQLWIPPGCFGRFRGSRDSLPHHGHLTTFPPCPFPWESGTSPAHRPHLSSSPARPWPWEKVLGRDIQAPAFATQLSHRLPFLSSLLAPRGILLPLYFNPVFWEYIDQEGEMRDRDTCTH